MTPPPPAKTTGKESSESNDQFIKRVVKRAFDRSQLTTEVVDAEDPTASPTIEAASPFAAPVFQHLADRKNKPAVAEYVNYFHEANPQADSQEAYGQASDFLRSLEGKPKKKRPNDKKRKTSLVPSDIFSLAPLLPSASLSLAGLVPRPITKSLATLATKSMPSS